MWLLLNDCFLSIVKKDCKDNELLVRARRPGDIEKVFGRRTKVTRATDADYLYRAVIARDDVVRAMQDEVLRINYDNFKNSVQDDELHDAYLRVWTAMASLQNPRPYSEAWVPKYDLAKQVETLGQDSLLPPKKKTVNVVVPCSKVVDAKTGKDITGQPHVRYVGRTKKNSKQSKRERALIRKNGAAVGTEPKESK